MRLAAGHSVWAAGAREVHACDVARHSTPGVNRQARLPLADRNVTSGENRARINTTAGSRAVPSVGVELAAGGAAGLSAAPAGDATDGVGAAAACGSPLPLQADT